MTGLDKYKGLLYLAGLLIAGPWLVYNMAIKDTVKLKRELKRTEKEIIQIQSQGKREASAPMGIIPVSHNELQDGDLISKLMSCEAGSRCTVVKYTPYITENRDGLAVHTAELVLSGTYTDLVRLIEQTESRSKSYRLVSTTFKSIKQRQRKQTQLHATLILQQITKTT